MLASPHCFCVDVVEGRATGSSVRSRMFAEASSSEVPIQTLRTPVESNMAPACAVQIRIPIFPSLTNVNQSNSGPLWGREGTKKAGEEDVFVRKTPLNVLEPDVSSEIPSKNKGFLFNSDHCKVRRPEMKNSEQTTAW